MAPTGERVANVEASQMDAQRHQARNAPYRGLSSGAVAEGTGEQALFEQ